MKIYIKKKTTKDTRKLQKKKIKQKNYFDTSYEYEMNSNMLE